MSTRIRILLIISTLLFFLILLRVIRKDKLTLDIAVFWIIYSLILLLIAIFPDIVSFVGGLLGIATTMYTLFLSLIFILICMVFFLLIKISDLEKKINNLAQKYALDKKDESENVHK